MAKRIRPWAVADCVYGPEAKSFWAEHPPSPSDVSKWLEVQRVSWTVRKYPKTVTINQVTAWARSQGLKRLDWDFIPKKKIWFRDPQVAMIWDLTFGRESQKTVDE